MMCVFLTSKCRLAAPAELWNVETVPIYLYIIHAWRYTQTQRHTCIFIHASLSRQNRSRLCTHMSTLIPSCNPWSFFLVFIWVMCLESIRGLLKFWADWKLWKHFTMLWNRIQGMKYGNLTLYNDSTVF